MTYQLVALSDSAPSRPVGEYSSYEGALLARIDDVIDQLRTNDGWWLRVDHVITGPGVDGPLTAHPLCTGLGVDPGAGKVPTETDLDDARSWLMFAHGIHVMSGVPGDD